MEYKRKYLVHNSVPYVYNEGIDLFEQFMEIVAKVETLENEITPLSKEFDELITYVNTYFSNLDIDASLTSILHQMVEDGEFNKIINEEIFSELNSKINKVFNIKEWNDANCVESASYTLSLINFELTDNVLIPIHFNSVITPSDGVTIKINDNVNYPLENEKGIVLGNIVSGKDALLRFSESESKFILFASGGGDSSGTSNIYDSVPVGTIIANASNTTFKGYLPTNGGAISREEHSELFAVIGTIYGGGDGISTFNLPVSSSNYGGIVKYDLIKSKVDPFTENVNNLDDEITKLKTDISTLSTNITNLPSLLFPIGRIISVNDTNDYSNYLGFKWKKLSEGVGLISKSSDEEFKTIGLTGGEITHVLNENEIPAVDITARVEFGENPINSALKWYGTTVSDWSDYNVGKTSGGGQPHNNLQPYEVIAGFWQRTE